MIDNHIQQGNVQGIGGTQNGTPREDDLAIIAASEVMATFCLSADLKTTPLPSAPPAETGGGFKLQAFHSFGCARQARCRATWRIRRYRVEWSAYQIPLMVLVTSRW